MKLILHIGTEKTGTTSIQKYLYQNRDLLEENGIYIPKSFGNINHRSIPGYCKRSDKFDDFHIASGILTKEERKSFEKEFENSIKNEFKTIPKHIHTVIISSEHFHSRLLFQDEIDNVKKLFEPFFKEIKIVVYLRRQIDLATSLYSTELKSGNVVPEINIFIKKRCLAQSHYFNYEKFLSLWECTFGKENLEIKLFDKEKFYENNLILDFSFFAFGELLENIRQSLVFPEKENESLTPLGQEILLLLNEKKAKESFDKYNSIANKINHLYRGEGKHPNYELAIDVMNIYAESNQQIQKKYFQTHERLFSNSFEKYKNLNTPSDYEKELKLFEEILELLQVAVPDQELNNIRDIAIFLEKIDINKAYELMKIVHSLRPNGLFIAQKVKEYENLI